MGVAADCWGVGDWSEAEGSLREGALAIEGAVCSVVRDGLDGAVVGVASGSLMTSQERKAMALARPRMMSLRAFMG